MKAPKNLKPMIQCVIEIDQIQFGNQHEEFRDHANKELLYGLSLLIKQPHHQERYKKFIGPLVYHPSPTQWSEAIASIEALTKHWL